jgi:transposase
MYIRTTQRKNADGSVVRYHQLAYNVRDPDSGQVTAKILHNFGRADELDREVLVRLCRSIGKVCGATVTEQPEGSDGPAQSSDLPEGVELLRTVELGTLVVVEALWERLGLRSIFEQIARKEGLEAPYERALLAMVANRLCEPHSKLGVWDRWLKTVYLPSCWDLKLEQLYAAMDVLVSHAAEVEQMVFFRTANLFNLEVDLVFYDTTVAEFCIDFEDEEDGQEPALRRWGRDKHGGSSVQVLVALAVTREGLPVRSWVFPGNTTDSTTVEKIRADLRSWKLSRCLFVGDAGMNSAENRHELAKACGKYVVAVRADETEVRDEVLTKAGRYKHLSESLLVKEAVVGDGELRRRYVLCFNPQEAERQKKRRAEVLSELRAVLASHQSRNVRAKWTAPVRASKRTGPYLSVDSTGTLYVDAEKVRAAEKRDGKWVLLTNDDTLSVEDVARSYRALEVIERCFRSLKSAQIELRPMFHWTNRRIEGHVKLCVLALLLQRVAELECKSSWMRLRGSLRELQATELRVGERRLFQRNAVPAAATGILKQLQIPAPAQVLSVQECSASELLQNELDRSASGEAQN